MDQHDDTIAEVKNERTCPPGPELLENVISTPPAPLRVETPLNFSTHARASTICSGDFNSASDGAIGKWLFVAPW